MLLILSYKKFYLINCFHTHIKICSGMVWDNFDFQPLGIHRVISNSYK